MTDIISRVIAVRQAQPAAPQSAQPAAPLHLSRRTLCSSLGALAMWQQRPAAANELCSLAATEAVAAGAASAGSGLAAEDVRRLYDESAASYDDLDDGPLARTLGFPAMRSRLLAHAHGDVLELAAGTGLNLAHYPWPQLTSLTAVDISRGMLERAAARAAALGLPPPGVRGSFVRADVAALPFPTSSFDCVVDTFSLCVLPDPAAALAAAAAALRPGGTLLLLEHARSRQPLLGAYQDATAGLIARSGGRGCMWNQQVPELVRGAGFEVVSLEEQLGGLLVAVEARLK